MKPPGVIRADWWAMPRRERRAAACVMRLGGRVLIMAPMTKRRLVALLKRHGASISEVRP